MGLLPPVTPMMELKSRTQAATVPGSGTPMLTSAVSAPSRGAAGHPLPPRVSRPGVCGAGATSGGLRSQGCAPPVPQAARGVLRWCCREQHPVAGRLVPRRPRLSLWGLLQCSAWQDGLPRWEWGVCGTLRDRVLLAAQGSLSTVSLFADAQKFKTKFEECRKEIEERKKGAGRAGRAGRRGCSADSLCTQQQPDESPRLPQELAGAVTSAL